MSEIKCPHCEKEFGVALSAHVPEKQTFKLRMTSQSHWFDAEVLGKQLIAVSKAMKCVAEELKTPVLVLVCGFNLVETEVEIEFLIINAAISKAKGEA